MLRIHSHQPVKRAGGIFIPKIALVQPREEVKKS